MPNDCVNNLTITANEHELKTMIEVEFNNKLELTFGIKYQGLGAVILTVWSRWVPDYEFLDSLLTKYPSSWIKDEWSEEGGKEGVWVGQIERGEKVIKTLEWQGMCIEEKLHRFRIE